MPTYSTLCPCSWKCCLKKDLNRLCPFNASFKTLGFSKQNLFFTA